jgi:hypothetical protein
MIQGTAEQGKYSGGKAPNEEIGHLSPLLIASFSS